MDLREAAMLGMTQVPDQGDDVQTELVPRQDEPTLLLGAQGHPESWAIAVAAAANLDAEPDHAVEGGDNAVILVGGPERATARRADPGLGRQLELTRRLGAGGPSGHRSSPGALYARGGTDGHPPIKAALPP